MSQTDIQLNWNDIYSSQKWGEHPAEDFIRFIARNFYAAQDRSTIKILEIGCGPAANLWFLARKKFVVYGVDISDTAISLAGRKLDEESPGWVGDLVVSDIEELPFENEFFDAVIDCEAVYCNSFEKSKKIYGEAARVLKKGGLLYTRTFASGCWGDKTGQSVGYNAWLPTEGPFVGAGFTRFTEQADLVDLLSKFKIEQLELISRTTNNLRNELKEWSISAKKI